MDTLQFTDGTTTVNFVGATGYDLLWGEWAPGRARKRAGLMGGRSPYAEVDEEFTIAISGSTVAQCLSRLGTLSDLLDQAERWANGDADAAAVEIKYKPTGSALSAAVEAIVLGPPPGRPAVIAPGDFDAVEHVYRLQPVRVSFRRRGLWLGATEAKSSAASSGNPAVMTLSSAFTDDNLILTPYDLQLASSMPATLLPAQGFIILTNAAAKIQFFEAEDQVYSDATYLADLVVTGSSAGSVAQCKGTMTTGNNPFIQKASLALQTNELWAAFAGVNNKSGSDTWHIRAYAKAWGVKSYSPWKVIEWDNDGVQREPEPIFIGYVSVPRGATVGEIGLQIHNTNGSGATPADDLYIDYGCFVGMDESTRIIYAENIFKDTNYEYHNILHRLDSDLTPIIFTSQTSAADPTLSTNYEVPHKGDLLLAASGDSISGIVLAVDGYGNYVHEDSAGEANITLTATRHKAYLTPL